MSTLKSVDWNDLANELNDESDGSETSGENEDCSVGRYRRNRSHGTIDAADMNEECISGLIVEHPPSSPEVERASVETVGSRQEQEKDVLDLYCEDTDFISPEIRGTSCYTESSVVAPSRASNRRVVPACSSSSAYNEGRKEKRFVGRTRNRELGKDSRQTVVGSSRTANDTSSGLDGRPYKRPSQPVRKQRRGRRQTADTIDRTFNGRVQPAQRRRVDEEAAYNRVRQHCRWNVRWVRSGYEHLVYDICNCNEAPNVVFAGLCYRQYDVYTMVLRNCDGKRRYWYDDSARRGHRLNNAKVSDFERAMQWRANAIGRVSTSPGYDLAAFVLQNVATDKRCFRASTTTPSSPVTPPLIVVTTDNMLDDSSIHRQLVYEEKEVMYNERQTVTSYYRDRPQPLTTRVPCRVCRCSSAIVTHDNASVPVFTCWQHSASYMAGAGADSTRVCNAVVVDMQFLHDRDSLSDEIVCRLRLVKNGGNGGGSIELSPYTKKPNNKCVDGVVTIAELVLLPLGVHTALQDSQTPGSTESVLPIDLQSAHSSTCQDRHYNVEDLFPSMPIDSNGRGGVHFYDTTIGLVVDRIHCIASAFQR